MGQTKPNINNCQKYFTCETLTIGSSFGKWESKSCVLNKLYDTKSQICLETGQATCGKMNSFDWSSLKLNQDVLAF